MYKIMFIMRKRVIFALIVLAIFMLSGTVFFNQVERWSLVDSFYFTTITMTTIGYGDLSPTTDISKIFTAVFSIFGVAAMFFLMTSVINVFFSRHQKRFENKLASHKQEIKKEVKKEIREGIADKVVIKPKKK